MLNVILIATHKQRQTALQIITAVLESKPTLCRLVVVYEFNQDDISPCFTNKLFDVVLAQHAFTGFSAGANRDIGIQFVEQHYPCTNHYVFLDGDCIPSTDLLEHHAQVLSRSTPVITCGSRKNQLYSGSIVEDKRLVSPLIRPRVFVPNIDRVAFDVRDIRPHNVVWSCNLGINASAVKNIRKANACISSSNRVFSDVFDGKWGGEDTLLGLAGFHTSTPIVCLDPNRSWVTHQEHDISYQGTSNLKRVFGYEVAMQECLDAVETLTMDSTQVLDTTEFYSSICHATQSAWMLKVCEYHKLSEQETHCIAFMFGANPKLIIDQTGCGHGFTQAQLSKLYHKLRTTPIGYEHVVD